VPCNSERHETRFLVLIWIYLWQIVSVSSPALSVSDSRPFPVPICLRYDAHDCLGTVSRCTAGCSAGHEPSPVWSALSVAASRPLPPQSLLLPAKIEFLTRLLALRSPSGSHIIVARWTIEQQFSGVLPKAVRDSADTDLRSGVTFGLHVGFSHATTGRKFTRCASYSCGLHIASCILPSYRTGPTHPRAPVY